MGQQNSQYVKNSNSSAPNLWQNQNFMNSGKNNHNIMNYTQSDDLSDILYCANGEFQRNSDTTYPKLSYNLPQIQTHSDAEVYKINCWEGSNGDNFCHIKKIGIENPTVNKPIFPNQPNAPYCQQIRPMQPIPPVQPISPVQSGAPIQLIAPIQSSPVRLAPSQLSPSQFAPKTTPISQNAPYCRPLPPAVQKQQSPTDISWRPNNQLNNQSNNQLGNKFNNWTNNQLNQLDNKINNWSNNQLNQLDNKFNNWTNNQLNN